ncbi:hypothetical protein NLJ89_g9991 [Agrocybe chaxingu]|uniref:Uncharacterized protein n=1 Tax=Agrocybe chaxingu TaxID=84603 RepID=A0A9W8JRL6_9AGAR|nr:hypothetical protein NLJ89_g9991 [Agrocybe chaxingu]
MQLKSLIFVALNVLAVVALDLRARQEEPPADLPVFTGKRVFHTIIDKSPFLIESTTTFTWTQSASISATESVVSPTPTAA